jgi:hypothetical protein
MVFLQETTAVDFQRDIRPLLSDRCFSCHGPDSAGRDSELRLDSIDSAFADLGGYSAIVPGDLEASELIYRITADDPNERMPEKDSGLSLSAEEIELFKTWIEEGAEFTKHWAFEKPAKFLPPIVRNILWPRDPVDQFILRKLESLGLEPAQEADPLVWLRRVHFALIGLPPSADDIRNFLANVRLSSASDSAGAYEKVVDKLLASPHFGERMAQPWLDIARYADTYGYQSDVGMRVWPYRDWVIQAFNDNLGYDQFLSWQIAGDLIPNASVAQKTATAFNRLHRQTNEGGSVEEEYRIEYASDRMQTTGTAFMGLTMECARCHDHRYDPISQKEYYQLFAYFDDIDESGLYSHFTSATPTPAVDLPTDAQSKTLENAQAKVIAELVAAGNSVALPDLSTLKPENATARFTLDERTEVTTVESPNGKAVLLDGDTGVRLKGAGAWRRSDPFSISVLLKADREYERAVVLHRSRAWTDAASQGWQILIEDGRILFALVHFWPGNAVAIKSEGILPLNEWLWVTVTSDGSSKAAGLQIHFNNQKQTSEIVRDSLTRAITGGGPGDPTIGERFRDRGFAGGLVDEILFFDFAANNSALAHLRDVRLARDTALDRIPQLMVMEEMLEPRQAFLLERGNYLTPGEAVSPATPAFLGEGSKVVGGNRTDLSEWLLRGEHPLTTRVEVDRLWRTVFGKGLVRTPENFGSQGSPPTHPELLDYLAWELRKSNWNRKALLKRLALSATFRQSSSASSEAWQADPENLIWARGPSFALPAEMLRDNALFASGLLVSTVGGPSVLPYQPAGLWKDKGSATYTPSKGEGLYRRSLYTYWKRTSPPPAMVIMDSAKRDVCVVRRQSTNTPLQALVLWNDPQFGEAARVLAAEICVLDTPLEEAFLRLTGRFPRAQETAALIQLFQSEKAAFQKDLPRAEALLAVGEAPKSENLSLADHAAWTMVCAALMASDPVAVLR